MRPKPIDEYCFGSSKLILGNSLKKNHEKLVQTIQTNIVSNIQNQIVWNSLENHKIPLQQP